MKPDQFVPVLIWGFMLSAPLPASPGERMGVLPRCEILITKVQIAEKNDGSIIRIAAKLKNESTTAFVMDVGSLIAVSRRITWFEGDGMYFEVAARPEMHGSYRTGFSGERLLQPGTTNAVRFQIVGGAGGLVPVNLEWMEKEARNRRPTNLTYIVFGVLEAGPKHDSKEGSGNELVLSGHGHVGIDRVEEAKRP